MRTAFIAVVITGSIGIGLAIAHAEPAPSASAPAGSSAPTAATDSASLRGLELPNEKSSMPKRGEWSEARAVRVERPSSRCKTFVLREWLRVVCPKTISEGITLLTGDRKDVYFWVSEQQFKNQEALTTAWWEGSLDKGKWIAEIVLPMRRGDRRLMQIAYSEPGSGYGPGETGGIVVSEQWLDGEAGPIVTID